MKVNYMERKKAGTRVTDRGKENVNAGARKG